MSSWPNATPARRNRAANDSDRVLRGDQAAAINSAQLDGDLRGGKSRVALNDEALEVARKSASAQGYADGWSEGQKAATAAVRAEAAELTAQMLDQQQQYVEALSRAMAAMHDAASTLERRMAQPMAEAEAELSAAAVDLAEALLGHEISMAEDPTYDAIQRALVLTPANRPLILRLNPAEAGAVQRTLTEGNADVLAGRAVTVVGDASVAPLGCIVECDATRIDAQLGPALARVREALAT